MADSEARRRWLGAGIVLLIGLAVLPWSAAARRAAPLEVLQFNIDYVPAVPDGYPGDTVSSDGRTSSPGWQYEDYRLSTSTDLCVSATRGAGSLGFITLNRPMDDGGRCDTNPQPAGTAASRQWVITIADPDACGILNAYDWRYVSPSPYVSGEPYVDGPCTLTGSDLSRIRIDKLLASKLPSTTSIDFLLKSFAGVGAGYEVRSVTKAQLLGTGDVRTLSYAGAGRLWGINPYEPISVEFPMRVHMTLKRTKM